MDEQAKNEILRTNSDLFAWPKCHIRETSARELGISEETKKALLELYTLPETEEDQTNSLRQMLLESLELES